MNSFESRGGSHWKYTYKYRPLKQLYGGDQFWFVLGHILLLPLALLVLLITALCLPLYWLWGRRRRLYPVDMHGEAKRIVADPFVQPLFVDGIRDDVQPQVSVVIPFYNRVQWVDWTIGSVLRQQLPPGTLVEIIAVDNGSTDGTAERLGRHPVRIVRCDERGPGAARNAGIAAARAPVIAFTDSDCLVDDHWLWNITDAFRDPDVLAAGGRIISLEQDVYVASFTDCIGILNNERFFEGSGFFPPFFATANAAYRRNALQKVGGFDNSLWMSEDADLAWRVLGLGGTFVYREDAVVYHQHRKTLGGLWRQALDYGAASVAIFAKHRRELNATYAISWKNIRDIAWSPVTIIHHLIVGKDPFDRRGEVIYALWRLGFTLGCIRESIRRRVLFI